MVLLQPSTTAEVKLVDQSTVYVHLRIALFQRYFTYYNVSTCYTLPLY